jgi:beta-galactosidase
VVDARGVVVPGATNAISFTVHNGRLWVSVDWPNRRRLDTVTAYFTIDQARGLPAAIRVSYWDGKQYVPLRRPDTSWATDSNQPTTITFHPVRTDRVRLDLTSRAPDTPTGFLQIAELRAG